MADKKDSSPTRSNDAPQTPSGGEQRTVRLDDSELASVYANFCRISTTPHEVILDFALNPHPPGVVPEVLALDQRVIMNFYTAKQLLGLLQMIVQRHEATYGVLEMDLRKRMIDPNKPS